MDLHKSTTYQQLAWLDSKLRLTHHAQRKRVHRPPLESPPFFGSILMSAVQALSLLGSTFNIDWDLWWPSLLGVLAGRYWGNPSVSSRMSLSRSYTAGYKVLCAVIGKQADAKGLRLAQHMRTTLITSAKDRRSHLKSPSQLWIHRYIIVPCKGRKS